MTIHRKNQSFRKCLMGCSVALFGLSVAAADREFFVAPEGDDVNNDGLSWASPFKTIQRAVDEQEPGEYFVITVSNGTYNVTEPIHFVEDGGVKLRSLTGDPKDVVIDGGGACACLWNENAQSRNYLSGITFQNGYSTASGVQGTSRKYAGGVYMNQRCFITNCVVRNCSHVIADGSDRVQGGGLYVINQADNNRAVDHWGVPSLIVDTLIENCAAVMGGETKTTSNGEPSGGGAYVYSMNLVNVTVRGCSVTNANAESIALAGGGLCAHASIVSNCQFVGNSLVITRATGGGVRGSGAGVCLTGDSSDPATGKHALLVDCVVSDNVSSGSGAGVHLGSYGRMSRVAVTNNTSVSDYGTGGMPHWGAAVIVAGENAVVENCLIEGNDVTKALGFVCGGLTVRDTHDVTVRDTVIRRNVASAVGGLNIVCATSVVVTNCVIAENVCTNDIPAVRVYENPSSPATFGAVEIVDSFIVSNVNVRPTVLNNGSGVINYMGGSGVKADKKLYMIPFYLRNCLVAGNTETSGRGWLMRYDTGSPESSVLTVPDVEKSLVVDHCTFANNLNVKGLSYYAVFASALAASNVLVRSCVFKENRHNNGSSLSRFSDGTYGKTDGVTIEYTYADVTNTTFVVTDENHNLGPDAGDVGFADPANGNFALTSGSCLVDKGGPFAGWMGNGRSRSTSRDLSGGYAIVPCGPYGVAVTRPNSNPRRYGAASDIGCCEYWQAPGLLLFVR